MKQHQNGISLIELLLAISMGIVVVITLSVAFPTASKNILLNKQRWLGASVASTQIQMVKSRPYDYLDTADTAWPSVWSFPASNPNCDCTAVDFTTLPSTSTQVGTTTFTQATCVNYVTSAWLPQCATSGDTGYKHIIVRVWWTLGASSATVTQESLLSRY